MYFQWFIATLEGDFLAIRFSDIQDPAKYQLPGLDFRNMQDRQLYEQMLGIRSPWYVESVELQSWTREKARCGFIWNISRSSGGPVRSAAGMRTVRSPTGAAVAAFGHVPVSDHHSCVTAEEQLS